MLHIGTRVKKIFLPAKYCMRYPSAINYILFGKGKIKIKKNAVRLPRLPFKKRITFVSSEELGQKNGWHFIGIRNGLFLFENAEEGLVLAQPHHGALGENLTWWIPKHGKGTAIDIGGYFGETAVLLAKRGFENVVVYEPVPENVQLIALNAQLNKMASRIRVVHAAVCNIDGTIEIESSSPPGSVSFGLHKGDAKYKLEVSAVSWNSVLNNAVKQDCTFIKVDCEGCEKYLLDIPDELVAKIPYWVIETHTKELEKEITSKMLRAGFMTDGQKRFTQDITLIRFVKEGAS